MYAFPPNWRLSLELRSTIHVLMLIFLVSILDSLHDSYCCLLRLGPRCLLPHIHMPTGQSPIASSQSQEYGIYSWDVKILDWKKHAILSRFCWRISLMEYFRKYLQRWRKTPAIQQCWQHGARLPFLTNEISWLSNESPDEASLWTPLASLHIVATRTTWGASVPLCSY